MKTTFILLFSIFGFSSLSQVVYTGMIDQYPIKLVTNIYSDGAGEAIYAYDKFDTPIILSSKLKGKALELYESDPENQVNGTFRFENFNGAAGELVGTWTNKDRTKTYKVVLKKDLDIENAADFTQKEMIQTVSDGAYYFLLLIDKKDGDARVSGVKVMEKKTDRLVQHIELDCQLWGLHNCDIGDFNFDGVIDLSVFESSYAGANTSSIYILRKPDSETWFVSDIMGVSLSFDAEKKLIYEHNQCCAGREYSDAVYKVVDNQPVLLEMKCYILDEERGEFVEKACE